MLINLKGSPLLHFSALCDIFRKKIFSKFSSFFQIVLRFLSLRYSADFRRSGLVITRCFICIVFVVNWCLLTGTASEAEDSGHRGRQPVRPDGGGPDSETGARLATHACLHGQHAADTSPQLLLLRGEQWPAEGRGQTHSGVCQHKGQFWALHSHHHKKGNVRSETVLVYNGNDGPEFKGAVL